jgi:hypothetical protein
MTREDKPIDYEWECEHCGKTHNTKKECDEHEKHCKIDKPKENSGAFHVKWDKTDKTIITVLGLFIIFFVFISNVPQINEYTSGLITDLGEINPLPWLTECPDLTGVKLKMSYDKYTLSIPRNANWDGWVLSNSILYSTSCFVGQREGENINHVYCKAYITKTFIDDEGKILKYASKRVHLTYDKMNYKLLQKWCE